MDSPLSYIGGKSRLSSIITSMIPEGHNQYCEVFAGAAWILFRKEPSKYEAINDRDGDLIAFYRVLQNHLEEFLRQFKWLLSSREWFQDWKSQIEARGLTDIQRAARYYYLQRHCFGGRVKGRTWGPAVEHAPRINLLRLEEELSEVHLRLIRVIIDNLDWSDFIRQYDRKATFFYMDPPYWNLPFYKHNFETADFEKMAQQLSKIRGKFLMSLNDHPEVRKIFSKFDIQPVKTQYSVSCKHRCSGTELLIKNY